jgi:hypothetical protein
MICTLVPNSGRMRAPITVKGATLEPIILLMNWRPEAKK